MHSSVRDYHSYFPNSTRIFYGNKLCTVSVGDCYVNIRKLPGSILNILLAFIWLWEFQTYTELSSIRLPTQGMAYFGDKSRWTSEEQVGPNASPNVVTKC